MVIGNGWFQLPVALVMAGTVRALPSRSSRRRLAVAAGGSITAVVGVVGFCAGWLAAQAAYVGGFNGMRGQVPQSISLVRFCQARSTPAQVPRTRYASFPSQRDCDGLAAGRGTVALPTAGHDDLLESDGDMPGGQECARHRASGMSSCIEGVGTRLLRARRKVAALRAREPFADRPAARLALLPPCIGCTERAPLAHASPACATALARSGASVRGCSQVHGPKPSITPESRADRSFRTSAAEAVRCACTWRT